MAAKRLSQHRPFRRVDADPIAVQRDFHAALGPKIGIGAPADIGEQAGGPANAARRGIVIGEQRGDPAVDSVPMAAKARLRLPFRLGRDQQGIMPPDFGRQRFVQQSFAQAIGGHHQSARFELAHHHRQQGGGIGQRRHARSRHGRNLFQPRLVDMADDAGQLLRARRGHVILMDDRQRKMRELHVEARQRPPRPADHVEGQARLRRPSGLVQHLGDRTLQCARPLGANLRQAQHPQRQRYGLFHRPAPHPRQFQAAATQIADNAVRARNARQDAHGRADRLLRAGQQFDREPHGLGAGDEVGAIGRIAHRRRGDAAYFRDLHRPAQMRKAADGAQAPLHRFGLDRSGAGERGTQPRHHLFIEQDEGDAARPVIDDQAHAVRSDVDDRRARMGGLGRSHHLFGYGPDTAQHRIHGVAQPPLRKRKVGTASLSSAAPRPESEGLVMK